MNSTSLPVLTQFVSLRSVDDEAGDTGIPPDSPLATWVHQNDLPVDFASRLASQRTLPSSEEKANFRLPMSAGRLSLHTSTFARSSLSEDDSAVADSMPPLMEDTSDASSSPVSALGTDIVTIVSGGFILDSQDGNLTRRERLQFDANLLCPFQVLDCDRVFATVVDFKMHIFSHFRGHPLPPYAPCFLCDETVALPSSYDPSLAWNRMLTHMAYDHFRGREMIGIFRPKMALMRYMWNRQIISTVDFTRCQLLAEPTVLPGAGVSLTELGRMPEAPMAPSATPPSAVQAHLSQSVGSQSEAVVVTQGRRAERRQRDAARMMSHV